MISTNFIAKNQFPSKSNDIHYGPGTAKYISLLHLEKLKMRLTVEEM
jgi:hypothetical protein